MNRPFLWFLILITFLFSPKLTVAQGIPATAGSIDITSSNDSPVPGQKVTITARSFNIDINSSTIIWTVNGKISQKGIGLTQLELAAPALGKEYKIEVSAITTDGLALTKSIILGSGSVDMIMESNGYIPPFFKGKLPVAYQNNVNIIAVPHIADSKGVEYDPKTLVYQWKKNSRVVEDQSGYGKQTFTLVGDIIPREAAINVTASTRDGTKRAVGYITVSYDSPSLLFYVDSPQYGPLFNSAIGDSVFIGKEKETSVLMVPYGFNKPINGIGNLILTWMINGYEREELATNESVTLRSPGETAGKSNVELTIKNKKDILQTASRGFSASFSANSTGSTQSISF
jgi:hypothetical protein